MANLNTLKTLCQTTPSDFRFPILSKLDNLANEYVQPLNIQLTANHPMSMLKVKDIYKNSKVLDEQCPLIIKIFAACCKDFLGIIHGSDFCLPNSSKFTDTAYIVGFGIMSFEDRSSLRFKNENKKIQAGLLRAELKEAKELADCHQKQDDIMRAIWHSICKDDVAWTGPTPIIPSITRVYNECEPEVIAKSINMFSWYERPRPDIKPIVDQHVWPVVDEIPSPISKFPMIQYLSKPKSIEKSANKTFQRSNSIVEEVDDRNEDVEDGYRESEFNRSLPPPDKLVWEDHVTRRLKFDPKIEPMVSDRSVNTKRPPSKVAQDRLIY